VGSLWLVLLFLAGGFQPARGPASWAVVGWRSWPSYVRRVGRGVGTARAPDDAQGAGASRTARAGDAAAAAASAIVAASATITTVSTAAAAASCSAAAA
jgi:hypothetical protein